MSDMQGALRSNVFRVNDLRAFKTWFETEVWFGDDIRVFTHAEKVAFGGFPDYPSAYPRVNDSHDNKDGEPGTCEFPGWDLDAFATAFRNHLADGETLYVIAGGNEKLRYVGFSELAVSHKKVAYQNHYSDDEDSAQRLLDDQA